MIGPALISLAFFLDLLVGDPPGIPHPVVLMGKLITVLERYLYSASKGWAVFTGTVMAVLVVALVYVLTAGVLLLFHRIHPLLAMAVEVWLLSSALAVKGLAQAAEDVLRPLGLHDLAVARQLLARIVGRDTSSMNEEEVVRATVETVAENTVDGIIAPLFYAFLGGAPLAMAYKAVNTLDSMVGYKNQRYFYFGRFSARLDDAANFLPARIGGLMLLLAAAIKGKDLRGAVRAMVRDSGKHPSPNSGISEAVVAGSLGIRLGGINVYHGKETFREYMGEDIHSLAPHHIRQTVALMYLSSWLALLTGLVIYAGCRL